MSQPATNGSDSSKSAPPLFSVQVTLKTWHDAHLLASEPWIMQWIYRGHGNHTWDLVTSLERSAIANLLPSYYFEREKRILSEFKRRVHHYIPETARQIDELEWLALIQHHGGSSRLLDFTHSFFVAAFFAL